MPTRTAITTLEFTRPFRLEGCDGLFAAGAYVVEVDEELLDGLSFLAYRRVRTAIHIHRTVCRPGEGRVVPVNGAALDEAIRLDRQSSDCAGP